MVPCALIVGTAHMAGRLRAWCPTREDHDFVILPGVMLPDELRFGTAGNREFFTNQ
jgi:hypothetical protein